MIKPLSFTVQKFTAVLPPIQVLSSFFLQSSRLVPMRKRINSWAFSFIAMSSKWRMEVKNEVFWTAMISECIAEELYAKVLELFRSMQLENVKPNRVTLTSILPTCAKLGIEKYGKEIHGMHGFDSDTKFQSAILHMYSECGEALQAIKKIFDRSTKKRCL
ncbi:hypothetical protein FXO38_02358 [Capsicum annuum]|nr:hypothetical protein FXO38_02358 [Capsicum annuum]